MLELLPVPLQDLDFPEAHPDAIGKLPVQLAGRLRQPVMHPQSLFPADDQSPFPEIRQVAGNRRLRQTESLMEMADAHLAIRQEIQQPEAYRISERLEEFDGIIQRIGGPFLYPHSRI